MEITFPEHMEQFYEVGSIQDAENKVKLENSFLSSSILYQWRTQKGRYLYGRCQYKRCRASFAFKKVGEVFQLKKFDNSHQHTAKGSKSALFNSIEEYLKELPINTSTATAKSMVCDKYRISKSTFYYLYRKVQQKKISYSKLTELLDVKKCEIHSDPFEYGMEKLPDLMLIVSPLMKQNFLKFGDWMGFDLTYHLIQEKSE